MVVHQRPHGVLGGLLWVPQARGALPGCDLQHPPPGDSFWHPINVRTVVNLTRVDRERCYVVDLGGVRNLLAAAQCLGFGMMGRSFCR